MFQSSLQTKGFLFVFLAALSWSTLGFVSRNLYESGFTSLEVTSLRIISAALFLSPVLFRHFYQIISFSLKQYILLGMYAFTGVFLFYWVEMESFRINPTGIAYVLLYTAPLILILSDTLFFKRKLSASKIICSLLILLGIIFITGLFGAESLGSTGLLLAVGSAFLYASYSLWGKYFSDRLNSNLVVSSVFFLAALMSLSGFPVQKFMEIQSVSTVFSIVYIGLLPTAAAYYFYNKSLNMISVSEASVAATIEPVFAVLWGITLLDESITGLQLFGVILILSAVVIIKIKE